jgi:hypothetical protein
VLCRGSCLTLPLVGCYRCGADSRSIRQRSWRYYHRHTPQRRGAGHFTFHNLPFICLAFECVLQLDGLMWSENVDEAGRHDVVCVQLLCGSTAFSFCFYSAFLTPAIRNVFVECATCRYTCPTEGGPFSLSIIMIHNDKPVGQSPYSIFVEARCGHHVARDVSRDVLP